MPSILTTARTGPCCSTVTCLTSLMYRSRFGELTGSSVGPLCRMQTSWPAPAICFPAMVIELRMFAPLVGSTHCNAPVSIVISRGAFLTVSDPAAPEPAPIESVAGALIPAGTTVAKPLHLSEPSGQYAIGQLCSGSAFPSATRLKLAPFFTAPCAPGTPQLTPVGITGFSGPSQESDTEPAT